MGNQLFMDVQGPGANTTYPAKPAPYNPVIGKEGFWNALHLSEIQAPSLI